MHSGMQVQVIARLHDDGKGGSHRCLLELHNKRLACCSSEPTQLVARPCVHGSCGVSPRSTMSVHRKQQTRATPSRPQRKRQTMMRPFDTIRLRSTWSLGGADLELSDGPVRFSRAVVVYAGTKRLCAREHSQHCGPSPQSEKERCTVRISCLPLVHKATVRRNVLNMVHGQLSQVSESVTFGAGYICNAFQCRENCRDKPFSAQRPLSNEADVEKRTWRCLCMRQFCRWVVQVQHAERYTR